MNRTSTVIALLAALFFGGTVQAQEHRIESWYLYFGLGYANLSYPNDIKAVVDDLKSQSGVSQASVDFDLLGVYWPLRNHQTLLGLNVNGGGDRFELGSVSLQLNQVQFSFSSLHFLTRKIGQGLFVRGDVGLSVFNINVDTGTALNLNESSETGLGLTVGGGYSFPVSSGTRIIINTNYSMKRIEGENFGKFNISVGGLF